MNQTEREHKPSQPMPKIEKIKWVYTEALKKIKEYIEKGKVMQKRFVKTIYKAINDLQKRYVGIKEQLVNLEEKMKKTEAKEFGKAVEKIMSWGKKILMITKLISKDSSLQKLCEKVIAAYDIMALAGKKYMEKKIKENLINFVNSANKFVKTVEDLFVGIVIEAENKENE